MDERHLHTIQEHLRSQEARERVTKNIERVRTEAAVTIGRAARLFRFSESQLRDWEKSGLLSPSRPKEGNENRLTPGMHGGQRQYSLSELDKLAVIRELIDEAHMSPGSIPPDIDQLWNALSRPEVITRTRMTQPLRGSQGLADESIDQRIISNYQSLGWSYYVTRALWLSLMMLHEDVPGYEVGLVLPFHEWSSEELPTDTERLPNVGPSLVGWLGQNRSFQTFISITPNFEYPTDYSVLPLCPRELKAELLDTPADRTLLIVVRERDVSQFVRYDAPIIRVAQRLLTPIYEDRELWQTHIGQISQNTINPNIDFSTRVSDAILTKLANMVIRLGGMGRNGEERWSACNILLPENPQAPLHQQTLIVRAKSSKSRMEVSKSTIIPERSSTSLSQRAYQSGHIMYRSRLAGEDVTALLEENEGAISSNIAVPIGGDIGIPLGVLYVSSYEEEAFDEDDQRLLRILARMSEEALKIYRARQEATQKLTDLLKSPAIVDPFFKEFCSETDFLRDIEQFYEEFSGKWQAKEQEGYEENSISEISFIAIDIDTSTREEIASCYGDDILRALNKAVGLRIRDLLPTLFTASQTLKLYAIYAGRYYLFLRDFGHEEARGKAKRLLQAIVGDFLIKPTGVPGGQLILPNISLLLGVTYYSREQLRDFLVADEITSAAMVSAKIYHSLDSLLKLGTAKGGKGVFAWSPETRTIERFYALE